MSIVAIADIQNELPTLVLNTTSVPNTTQVTAYISNIEAEVRGRLESCGAPPIPDGTTAADVMRRTIVEGVRWLTLRAKYAMSAGQNRSSDIADAYKAYMDRLGSICDVARATTLELDTQAGQAAPMRIPVVHRGRLQPNLSSSFGQYTEARDIQDWMRTAERSGGRWPWPLEEGPFR